jgi:hypothetical protein
MLVVERQVPADHCVKNNSTSPYVDIGATVDSPLQQLWGSIVRRSATCFKIQRVLHSRGESKVYQLDIVELINENILQLEISMGYLMVVRVFHSRDYLFEEMPGLILPQL